jgi:hypothetical protein
MTLNSKSGPAKRTTLRSGEVYPRLHAGGRPICHLGTGLNHVFV